MSDTPLPLHATTSKAPDRKAAVSPLYRFISANRAWLGTLAVLVVMMAIFMAANPLDGAVAQLGERVVRNDEVRSSILLSSTSGFYQTPDNKYVGE